MKGRACLFLTQGTRGSRQRGNAGLEALRVPDRSHNDDQEADTCVRVGGRGGHHELEVDSEVTATVSVLDTSVWTEVLGH